MRMLQNCFKGGNLSSTVSSDPSSLKSSAALDLTLFSLRCHFSSETWFHILWPFTPAAPVPNMLHLWATLSEVSLSSCSRVQMSYANAKSWLQIFGARGPPAGLHLFCFATQPPQHHPLLSSCVKQQKQNAVVCNLYFIHNEAQSTQQMFKPINCGIFREEK